MREQKIAVKKEKLLGYKLTRLRFYDEEKYKTLSDKTGYSKRSFSRYEKGECGINKTCIEGMASVYGVECEDFIKFLTDKDFSVENLLKITVEEGYVPTNEDGADETRKKIKIGRNVAIAAIISSACALVFLCVVFYMHLKDNVAAYGSQNVDFSHWILFVAIAVTVAAVPAACVFVASVIRAKIRRRKGKR